MAEAMVMDFETFAARLGVPGPTAGEHGAFSPRGNIPAAAKRRLTTKLASDSADYARARQAASKQYLAALKSGEIREPSQVERLRASAAGHPDLESTQAAIRALARRQRREEESHG